MVQYYLRSLIDRKRPRIRPFRIETGHYNLFDVNEPTCLVCKSGKTEDEIHIVCMNRAHKIEYR